MIDRERDLLKEFSQMQIPGHSCPYINEAIQRVSDAEIDARFALRQGRGYIVQFHVKLCYRNRRIARNAAVREIATGRHTVKSAMRNGCASIECPTATWPWSARRDQQWPGTTG